MKNKVKFGDIWTMGSHRLLCGDSTEAAMMQDFLKGMNPKLCVTDPPYGINYQSRAEDNSLYELRVKNDHMVHWAEAFKQAKAPVLYVWFSFKCFDITTRSVRDAGYEAKQMLVWEKNHFSLQRVFYHLQHEQVLLCTKFGVDQKGLWVGDRKQKRYGMCLQFFLQKGYTRQKNQ